MAEAPVEVVLLDLHLPREDGLSITRRLRALPESPGIIMATSLSGAVDRVVGLELGADDYISKPFELRELLARLRSLLRRRTARPAGQAPVARPAPSAGRSPAPGGTQVGAYRLMPDQRRLLRADGSEVPLTATELDLLLLLASRPGEVLSREQLMMSNGQDFDPFDRSIDIRITRLRRKIERDPTNPDLIRTVRGRGYVLSAETARD
jgi:two-component system phosphate regulon response regulator OmpR